MKARFEVVVALIAAALLLAACGSSSSTTTTTKTDFKTSYVSARNELQTTSEAIGNEIRQASSQTDAQIASQFHSLAVQWQAPNSQLQMLTPPANVTSNFKTLTSASQRVENDLNAISTAAQNHDASSARQSAMSLVTDIGTAKAASQAIDATLGLKPAPTGTTTTTP